MLNDAVQLLPEDVRSLATTVAVTGALVALALWMLGARFSRSIITLLTVAVGCYVGMRLPGWAGWGIDGMATGVLCATLLGISGFVCHRFWIAVGVGSLLAVWASIMTWSLTRHGATLHWPALRASTTTWSFMVDVWKSLPAEVSRLVPFVASTAWLSGVGVAVLWPRVATVLLWSMVGVSLALSVGGAKIPAALPSPTWAQVMIVLMFVAVGAGVQWKLVTAGQGKLASVKPVDGTKKKSKPRSASED